MAEGLQSHTRGSAAAYELLRCLHPDEPARSKKGRPPRLWPLQTLHESLSPLIASPASPAVLQGPNSR